MPYALIIQGEVTEIISDNPEGKYHPNLQWVECGNDVSVGYRYDGQTFSPPPPEPGLEDPNSLNLNNFYQEFEHTAIDDAMGDTIASNDWLRLNIRISKVLDRGSFTEEDKFVIQYLWNSVIDGLENPLDAEMVNQLKVMADTHQLTGI